MNHSAVRERPIAGLFLADGENLAMEHRNIARNWIQWSGRRPCSNLLRKDHMYGI